MGNEVFESSFERVKKLSQEFDANKAYYYSPVFKESQARKDFIDKFFIALGWDVNHETQKNPYEQEVKVERPVVTGQSQRSADYAFYVKPNFHEPRLFVEAKKPSRDLISADNCFQTIRYGWNANMPLAVLTNFDQLVILDCRYRPDIEIAVEHACQTYQYSDYSDPDKFAKIFYLIGRDAIADGSLNKFGAALPRRRGKAIQRGLFRGGYQPVDESFLEELDGFRDELARNFKNHNPKLDGETLTEVTQRTLDRLVFLRFLEDKTIEPKPYVSEFGAKGDSWHEFVACCSKLDNVYNGVVFKSHDVLDAPSFAVDKEQFSDLCEKLAHINSPYDFNSIPIHILGSIYERFLGKVIVVSDKRAHVELKPEVRKAGGVYYTPNYVVRYIVANTVEKLIIGKTPAQIAGMRFADIACGSGSFLLAIFEAILRYHFAWFNDNPGRAAKDGCVKRDDGHWHLSLGQRRRILLNNIYGVDIDHQAVEVAQMSLYLRLLEEETTASARNYQLEVNETILPPLNKNIVCGNSLVNTDILDGKLFPAEEERKLNPMNFEDRFPDIMKRGGFDAIIGNPPWGGDIDEQLEYYHGKYPDTTQEHTDSYKLFIDRSLCLVRDGGLSSMIVPNTVLRQRRLKDVRNLMLMNRIRLLADLGENVFAGVVAPSCVFVIEKGKGKLGKSVKIVTVSQFPPAEKPEALAKSDQASILVNQQDFQRNADFEFMASTKRLSIPFALLGEFDGLDCRDAGINYQRVRVGMQEKGKSDLADRLLYEGGRKKREDKMYWKGSDIDRYWIASGTSRYCRPNYKEFIRGNEVVHLNEEIFDWKPKILLRQTADRIIATIDYRGVWFGRSIIAIIAPSPSPYAMEYFLGILNSRYFEWLYSELVHETGRVFAQVKLSKVKQLPMRLVDFSNPVDVQLHDDIVARVRQLQEAKEQLTQAKTDKDKAYYVNKCGGLDRQINQLVYTLYSLTAAEIGLVEDKTRAAISED